MEMHDIAYLAKPENAFAHEGVLGGKIQKARDNLTCRCEHKNVSHGYGGEDSTPWREGSLIGLGSCGIDNCTCSRFFEEGYMR